MAKDNEARPRKTPAKTREDRFDSLPGVEMLLSMLSDIEKLSLGARVPQLAQSSSRSRPRRTGIH
jgi:hypothetical protein